MPTLYVFKLIQSLYPGHVCFNPSSHGGPHGIENIFLIPLHFQNVKAYSQLPNKLNGMLDFNVVLRQINGTRIDP